MNQADILKLVKAAGLIDILPSPFATSKTGMARLTRFAELCIEAGRKQEANESAASASDLLIRLNNIQELIGKLHSAKGRHHTQIAVCDLFDAVGLSNSRPKGNKS